MANKCNFHSNFLIILTLEAMDITTPYKKKRKGENSVLNSVLTETLS